MIQATLVESNNETEQEMSCKAPLNQTDSPWSLLADLSLDFISSAASSTDSETQLSYNSLNITYWIFFVTLSIIV